MRFGKVENEGMQRSDEGNVFTRSSCMCFWVQSESFDCENSPRSEWKQQQLRRQKLIFARISCDDGSTSSKETRGRRHFTAPSPYNVRMCKWRKWEFANDVRKWFCTTKSASEKTNKKTEMHRDKVQRWNYKDDITFQPAQMNFIKTLCIRRRRRCRRRVWMHKEAQALYPSIFAIEN